MMYGNGMGAGWTLMIFAVVLPALLLTAGLIAAQLWRHPAERLLAARFARGEIQTEEYEQRLHTLRAGSR
ncbi:hypothetical protein AB0C29_15855 [Actinoplanes sp. NPDC048791]|uniref:hypothetical protein n=1 Tax=Actinoplanes sp. NPDC048791 TaxID=3154623 RepID=UPI0034010340